MIIVKHKEFEFKGWLWELYQPFTFEYGKMVIIIPIGFKTDFASVPKWLWSFIPSIGTYCEASLKHDFLYTVAAFKRKDVDKLFLKDMLLIAPKRKGRAYVMYWAVRLFGWIRWGKNHWNETVKFEAFTIK